MSLAPRAPNYRVQDYNVLLTNVIYTLPIDFLFLKVCAPAGFGRINQMGLAVMRHVGVLLPAARSRAAKSGAASAAKPILSLIHI